MTLKEQIGKDFLVAYKAKEMEMKNFLSVVIGTIVVALFLPILTITSLIS